MKQRAGRSDRVEIVARASGLRGERVRAVQELIGRQLDRLLNRAAMCIFVDRHAIDSAPAAEPQLVRADRERALIKHVFAAGHRLHLGQRYAKQHVIGPNQRRARCKPTCNHRGVGRRGHAMLMKLAAANTARMRREHRNELRRNRKRRPFSRLTVVHLSAEHFFRTPQTTVDAALRECREIDLSCVEPEIGQRLFEQQQLEPVAAGSEGNFQRALRARRDEKRRSFLQDQNVALDRGTFRKR